MLSACASSRVVGSFTWRSICPLRMRSRRLWYNCTANPLPGARCMPVRSKGKGEALMLFCIGLVKIVNIGSFVRPNLSLIFVSRLLDSTIFYPTPLYFCHDNFHRL